MTSSDESTLTVLLVEDCPLDAELARRGLDVDGRVEEIHLVTTGDEALDFLRREGEFAWAPRPDVVLLDLELPGRHGMEVLDAIRADDELDDVAVVVLTASDHPVHIASAYDRLAVAYMTKPVSLPKFEKVLLNLDTGFFAVVRGQENDTVDAAAAET